MLFSTSAAASLPAFSREHVSGAGVAVIVPINRLVGFVVTSDKPTG